MLQRLLDVFSKNGVISRMNFTIYHAGERAADYVDVDSILGDTEGRTQLTSDIVSALDDDDRFNLDEYDTLAFLDKRYGPVGLLPYASEIGNELGKPVVVLRLDEQIRLEKMKVKGINVTEEDVLADDAVLLLDDVINTGRTQEDAIDLVADRGGRVEGIISVYARDAETLDRLRDEKEVSHVDALLTYSDCLDYGLVLSDDPENYQVDNVEQWLAERYGLTNEQIAEFDEKVGRIAHEAVDSAIEGQDELAESREDVHDLLDEEVEHVLKEFIPRARLNEEYRAQREQEAGD